MKAKGQNMERKILIVDDDSRNIFALELTLKAKGYKVASALGAGEAIALLENDNSICMVLMDMMMPDIDGYQAIGMIKNMEVIADIPIVAVTAQAMEEDRQKCLDAGAVDYIKKPIDVDRLLNVIENVSAC